MIRIYLIILVFIDINFSVEIRSQACNDYVWVLGYPPNIPEEYFGGVIFDFKEDITLPKYFNINCSAAEPAILSSSYGRLLSYSEGCKIFNSHNEVMNGGDSINFGEIWLEHCEDGYPGVQNNLLLPWPDDTTRAVLFHLKIADETTTTYLLYSKIEFTNTQPLGNVTDKNIYLLTPGITGGLTAVKHANGRDWWIMLPAENTNRFYSLLLNNNGVTVKDSQRIGTLEFPDEGISQTVFSGDGKKYIVYRPYNGIEIFDFDRCTGALSDLIQSGPLSDTAFVGGGVAVSSDSRFLYASNSYSLFQFDLWATDILGSKILIANYDGYLNPFQTTIHQMRLAPNGKIFIFSSNGVKSVHVINHPDRKGLDCDFVQHGIELPAYINIGAVNLPNFRLGPDDGSFCDTLGINNSPIADFRYEIDPTHPLKVHFINLSYFEPEIFDWDFGNEEFSNLKSPSDIEYNTKGAYKVCLNVSNEYGENTFCRTFTLKDSITSTYNLSENKQISVLPNPCNNIVKIKLDSGSLNSDFYLYTSLGVFVKKDLLASTDNSIELDGLPEGVYFYNLIKAGNSIYSGKLVKIN